MLQPRDNKHSKHNQMSIETASVEQTMGKHDEAEVKR